MINPTNESYDFIFENVFVNNPELIPMHCNPLKGFVEGGTSTDVTFTFTPTTPGVRNKSQLVQYNNNTYIYLYLESRTQTDVRILMSHSSTTFRLP